MHSDIFWVLWFFEYIDVRERQKTHIFSTIDVCIVKIVDRRSDCIGVASVAMELCGTGHWLLPNEIAWLLSIQN